MVIRPVSLPTAPTEGCAAAWPVIEASQRNAPETCFLIPQDDHARLSGAIAAAFGADWAPRPPHDVIEAIALHDSGWTDVESELSARAAAEQRRPPSFIAVPVPDFLRAWTRSIEIAAERSPLAGILVSMHFASIGQMRMRAGADPPAISAQLRCFDEHESSRRQALAAARSDAPQQLAAWLDLLQFCDLVSLYMCAGSQEQVDLPQRLAGNTVCLSGHGNECRLHPSPLLRPLHFGVPAALWPGDIGPSDMYLTLS